MKFRKEFDSLGKILVPADKYWGASTQRSNKYFDIGFFGKTNCYQIYRNDKKSCSDSASKEWRYR